MGSVYYEIFGNRAVDFLFLFLYKEADLAYSKRTSTIKHTWTLFLDLDHSLGIHVPFIIQKCSWMNWIKCEIVNTLYNILIIFIISVILFQSILVIIFASFLSGHCYFIYFWKYKGLKVFLISLHLVIWHLLAVLSLKLLWPHIRLLGDLSPESSLSFYWSLNKNASHPFLIVFSFSFSDT